MINTRMLSMLALIAFYAASVQASASSMEAAASAIPVQDCVVEPSEIVDVGSAIPGVVEAIHVYRSDLVKKGAIIVELESSVEKASLELARVRAGQDAAIKLRQESARFGSLTQKREQELLRKSAISLHDVDKSKTETRIAELQVQQEQDNKAISELEYRRAQMVLQQRRIRSPVEGVVMERFKSVGEFVEDEPVVRVAQLNPLHVEVIVPVDYWGSIVPGMQADVTTGLASSGVYRATVERVDRVADAASGTYGVRLSLPNPDYTIPAGLRCQLSFLPQSLNEPEEADDDTRVVVSAESDSEGSLERCFSVGPVEDQSTAELLAEKLEEQTDSLLLRTDNDSVEVGYRVLASQQSNPQQTAELLTGLAKAGIKDRFILAQGEHKGRVALGYFSKLAFANERQEMLALKGFDTEILPHRKDVQHYWLDVALKGDSDSPDPLKKITASLASAATLKPMACYPELAHR
ncbi:efflux RND transporter periplasmic adaptor subunit [Marinobacter sediminum]|uniref:efflux RND transporter periplasmic adaptor subunit n=1 Tax=Marinobacter sediminum TaxID=256323 RepID=UPI0035635BF6